jgi:hypothetical protein
MSVKVYSVNAAPVTVNAPAAQGEWTWRTAKGLVDEFASAGSCEIKVYDRATVSQHWSGLATTSKAPINGEFTVRLVALVREGRTALVGTTDDGRTVTLVGGATKQWIKI